MGEAFALMALDRAQVVTEITLQIEAQMLIFGKTVSITDEQSKVCGFELQMATQRMGKARCAFSLEDLVIPDVDSDEVIPDSLEMSPENFASKSGKKNLVLGLFMGLSLSLALLMLACGLSALRGPRAEARQVKITDKVKQQAASENTE